MEIKEYYGEVWRPIKRFEGLYEVSNYGRVKNVKTGYILKGETDWKGYRRVSIKEKHYKIHRLVAEAFLPNPNNLPQVNHKDEDKTNNFVYVNEDGTVDLEKSNLEWCSNYYNNRYGTRDKRVAEKMIGKGSKPVNQLDLSGNIINTYESIAKAKEMTGINCISGCCLKKKGFKTAGGYRWEFA